MADLRSPLIAHTTFEGTMGLRLRGSNLSMNIQIRFFVYGFEDIGHRDFFAFHLHFD